MANGYGVQNGLNVKSETILVETGDQGLASGNLLSGTTAINLANGQLGVVCKARESTRAFNAYIQAGDTVSDAPIIEIVQGTPNSANYTSVGPYEYSHKPYVRSQPINSRYSMAFQARVAQRAQFNSIAIGGTIATTQAIQVEDEALYQMHITLDGVRQNRYFSVNAFDGIHPSFTSPNFTTLSSLYTQPLDYLVQYSAYLINLNSSYIKLSPSNISGGNKPIVALAIRNTGGGSGQSLTGVAGLAIGAGIDIMTYNGVTHTLTVTEELKATVAQWIATPGDSGIVGASTIEVIDPTTAGTASGLGTEVILVMALDEEEAAVTDLIREKKPRIRVGVEGAFDTAGLGNNELSLPFEGTNDGRTWKIHYDHIAGKQVWSNERWGNNLNLITPPDYIDTTIHYNAFVIEHRDEFHVPYSTTQPIMHRTIILLPANADTGVSTSTTTVANLNAQLAPWLNSATMEHTYPGTTVSFT